MLSTGQFERHIVVSVIGGANKRSYHIIRPIEYQMRSDADNVPTLKRSFDLGNGLGTGYLVIDSDLGGGGTGGIRMGSDVNEDEVSVLAAEMSHKFAWLNIARGGAKSGIKCATHLSDADKESMLKDFGQGIEDVLSSQRYVAGMDLGIGPGELATIMSGADIRISAESTTGSIDSNYYTALTVFIAMTELLRYSGRRVNGTRVLVEGLGKVGRHLVRLIIDGGGIIVGVSTIEGALIRSDGVDAEKILSLVEKHGDECVRYYDDGPVERPAALYAAKADVLVPGARVHSIHKDNVNGLSVSFVVPMANAAATPAAEEQMYDNGVQYLPGFVTNSGGIFCWYLARLDDTARKIVLHEGFGRKISKLVREADKRKMSIGSLARQQVAMNARRMLAEERGSPLQQAIGIARKFSPRRLPYVVMSRIFGSRWAARYSLAARWYFDGRYFV